MENLWPLLPCTVVVGYFGYRDYRRIKRYERRNATGHCALCPNQLESSRLREMHHGYMYVGMAKVYEICVTCFDHRKKRRPIIWATMILIILALIILPRVIGR